MSSEKPKPYTIIVIISIVIITLMSIGILIFMSSLLQGESTRLTETTELISTYHDLASDDIQIILEEDAAKIENAHAGLYDLYIINDKYVAMIDYNQTHPLNYTQQDFDEVKLEFTILMRAVNNIVYNTKVYDYSTNRLGGSLANNYTNFGFKNYFIENEWEAWNGLFDNLHADIVDYVNASFVSFGAPVELPRINYEKWTYHLYNNLSMLAAVGQTNSYNYLINKQPQHDMPLVNLSLRNVLEYYERYVYLLDDIDAVYSHFNNTLITLALAGVLMGFATSFDNIKLRRISLIVGIVILLLAMVYFTSALSQFFAITAKEARIITQQGFTFA